MSAAGVLSSFLGASPSFPGAGVLPSVVASSVPAASAPSATSPSAGFSGSLITVGAATVAITKSLPVIVEEAFSGSLTDELLEERFLLI